VARTIRIEAARASRRFPAVLALLADGALNLGSLRLLIPHLTSENHEALFAAASGKSKRDVQALLARLFPRPDVTASVRKLPAPRARGVQPSVLSAPGASSDPATAVDVLAASSDPATGFDGGGSPTTGESPACLEIPLTAAPVVARADSSSPARRHPLVTPLSPDRYQIRFTASAQTCEKLRLAQDLLRHAVPSGDPAEIFDRALTALLEELGRRRFAATERPRVGREPTAGSRAIPAAIKRSVMARDEGCCAFVSDSGRRCGTRAFLEFHHVVPYAHGGAATVANIQMRCRAHNGHEADLCFGKSKWRGGEGVRNGVEGGGVAAVSPAVNSSRDELGALAQGQIDRPPDVLTRRAFEGHT
jgi:hypothetical protein